MRHLFFLWILLFLAAAGGIYGQTAQESPGNLVKLQLAFDVRQSMIGFRDSRLSAISQAQLADLCWTLDEPYARSVFRFSLSLLDPDDRDTQKEGYEKSTQRRKVISLIAKHDPAWAKTLIIIEREKKNKIPDAEARTAKELLESDENAAVDLAKEGLNNGISPVLVEFIKTLRQTNVEQANALFRTSLARFSSQPNGKAFLLALLGTYLFTSPNIAPDEIQAYAIVMVGGIGIPDLSANRPGVDASLATMYVRGVITLVQQPTTDEQERSMRYALGFQTLQKAREFSPNFAPELGAAMSWLAGSVPVHYTSDETYKYLGAKQGSPEDRLKEIEKNPDVNVRNQLYLDVAYQAFRRKDFKIARIAAGEIENDQISEELKILLDFGEINNSMNADAVDRLEIEKRINRMAASPEKALLWLRLAFLAAKAKDARSEIEMLGNARDISVRLSDQLSPYLLTFISGRMKERGELNPNAVFFEAIRAFNKIENIGNPTLSRLVSLEPLKLRFPLEVKDVNLDFGTSVRKLFRDDEENGILAANDLNEERLKGLAYIALFRSILDRKETGNAALNTEKGIAIGTQEKVIRVGEDGIRKSALKTELPTYPQQSIRNKKTGVAVAELQYNGVGDVTDVEIIEAPDKQIGEAVAKALRLWKFNPSKLEGNPVSIRGKVTFYFSINPKGKGEVKNPKQF